MGTKEMDTIEINGTNYMILEVIDKYYYLCINSNYDKYRIIKEKYNGYIIFIKVKDRYYTYDDDLLYMNNLFDIMYYYFRYSRLFNIKVNYVILDSNKIIIN